MKSWKESQEEVRKIKPDRQMASAKVRMKALEELKGRHEFASLVVEVTKGLCSLPEAICDMVACEIG